MATSAQEIQNYEMGDPTKAEHAYLNELQPLKNYINHEKFPNFRLGIGTTVDDYLNNSTIAGLTNDNFTETVAGNAMKMSSCVSNDGSMDFSKVKSYVEAADRAGLNIYGHTLAWHSQQPNGWLRSLIKDRPAEPFENPDTTVLVTLGSKDFRTQQSVGWTSDKDKYGFSLSYSSTSGLHIHTTTAMDFWLVQFVGYDNIPIEPEKPYTITFEIQGSAEGKLHTNIGDWSHGRYTDIPFTTTWSTVSGTYISEVNTPFMMIQCGDFVGDIYIRSIKVDEQVGAMKGDDGSIIMPQSSRLSTEEKREILTGAMEQWIKGMMEACDGKVKAWDVVNEAIGGNGNDGEGNYTLQHSTGYNGDAAWDVGGDSFYWQDHMGDLEYVRTAVRLARKYGPEDVKLFINDYNLELGESTKKLTSLINWIKKWEADGETHLDGIGTQMHIYYYENPSSQSSKKVSISNSFKLMARTGKLIRISEMDMGYMNAAGKELKTSELTDEQHKNMADFYEWIVKEYLRLIPAEQQWGICFWCPTDSPANSYWRPNKPVGIWSEDLFRKHVYGGIVNGLSAYTTGLDTVANDSESSAIYNLAGYRYPVGTRLTDLPSGLYIIDGKVVKN